MGIEWEETVETKRRVALVVDLKPSEPFDAPDEVRAATIDDLRRACEAVGWYQFHDWEAVHAICDEHGVSHETMNLNAQMMRPALARERVRELVVKLSEKEERYYQDALTAEAERNACQQHAEDLEKLGREMNEVVAQRDEARDIVASARELAGAEESESLGHAITRILGREDHERGAHLRLLDEVIAFGEVIGTKPDESIASAARRVVRERDAAIARGRAVYNLGRDAARGEVARMREEVAAANAHAEPAYRTVKSIGEILSVEPDYEKVIDKVRDTANEVATLRDRVDGLEIDLNSAVQNSKANEVEANNLRSANRTLRDRVAELEAIAREAESQARPAASPSAPREVRPADVPATLARLLDEVEAARKAVSK